MDKIIINGPNKLNGEVRISGSKNSALPIMAACLLTDQECIIKNVPDLKDVSTMISLLNALGLNIHQDQDRLIINTQKDNDLYEAPYDLVRRMRASICVLGPLLAKKKKARVSFPGGCIIGPRPVDLHIKALSAMGADIDIIHGFICAKANKLIGVDLVLEGIFGSSVLGTANMMMAGVLAEGKTIIRGSACEPEVVDLANFLSAMGANIQGVGSSVIQIEGVSELKGAEYEIIPDRIEAGTYLVAGAITGSEIKITNVVPEHLTQVVSTLRDVGQEIIIQDSIIIIKGQRGKISDINISTSPFPGFPTDMQAQLMSLLCVAKGKSVITERIYPDRFTHISELNRMGANIVFESGTAIVKGVDKLSGTDIMASDLRASAGLILAGLAATGTTTVSRIYHLDRGYERMVEKLAVLGADIVRVLKS